MRIALPLLALAACYTGAPANRDVQAAWRGRTRAEIVDRWGTPAQQANQPQAEIDVWSFTRTQFELPDANLAITPHRVAAGVDVTAGPASGVVGVGATVPTVSYGFTPGQIWKTRTDAAAFVQPTGTIAEVQGAALHWGPPNDVNLHWGTIFGAHVGMGRLDTTPTPLPSGGAYIGGMLSPTLGLVGTYSLVAGTSDMGGAMGMAGGLAAQWWPVNRLWLRAGPALLLAFDPGFDNARLRPGVTLGASYAFVKVGTLAVDARFDLATGPSTTFGTVGVGVNLN
ncbi:MAG: hypothetical protein ACM31C_29025 [Acidobacteriota bacterium]